MDFRVGSTPGLNLGVDATYGFSFRPLVNNH